MNLDGTLVMESKPCWRAGATASAGTVIAMTDIPRLFGLTAVIQSCTITPTRLLLVTHRVTEDELIFVLEDDTAILSTIGLLVLCVCGSMAAG